MRTASDHPGGLPQGTCSSPCSRLTFTPVFILAVSKGQRCTAREKDRLESPSGRGWPLTAAWSGYPGYALFINCFIVASSGRVRFYSPYCLTNALASVQRSGVPLLAASHLPRRTHFPTSPGEDLHPCAVRKART